jgi:predicted signal transduction protein with EAL and GGDEF domain
VADRILESFRQPFHLEEREVVCTVSIGISIYPDDGTDLEKLTKHADTAMYETKKVGRNNYKFFDPAMKEAAVRKLNIESRLRKALERNEFLLFYQPQFDLSCGKITCATLGNSGAARSRRCIGAQPSAPPQPRN